MNKTILIFICCFSALFSAAQNSPLRNMGSRFSQHGGGGQGGDSLRRRNLKEDSINLRYYYLDSSAPHRIDSSINDFTTRFPIPATYIYLGNTGTAARSILYAPELKAGWDPGFHALDIYKWEIEKVRFYNTSKPYTELGYLVGARAEQLIQVTHTQNIKPYWNFSFNYRLIASPGSFRNQVASHNNYLFTSWYQAPKKRYNNYFVILYNRLQVEESGGILDQSFLSNPEFTRDRFTIPVKIGGTPTSNTNFFSSAIYTGHRYRELSVVMRQQYDLGKKDSLVTDSTVIPLFFPRLRFEHTVSLSHDNYSFQDFPISSATQTNIPDSSSSYYFTFYNKLLPANDSLLLMDNWTVLKNDFSIYQYPDAKNLQQFIKMGAEFQVMNGSFTSYRNDTFLKSNKSLFDVMGHAEYRNRSKNQKWDILAFGNLYFTGYNAGDYHGFISLQRLISQKLGSLRVGFENVNRKPPFTYNSNSSFYLDGPKSFSKENTLHFFASAIQPKSGLELRGDYYLISNYLYLRNYSQLQQQAALFNLLRINAIKTFRIGRSWNWHAEFYMQQKTGSVPLNIPLFYTRNRFMYEGDLGFKNLDIAIGTEVRYHSPYKADNYSPVIGQFFYQDSVTINNRPEIDLFLQFRIRSFKAFLRVENLNSANTQNGFGFTNNNLAAPDYPMPGMVIRFGIFWSFVN